MRQRKYTLPRHTNLANQGPRIGAFFIDLAITLAITLGFIFGCFRFVFASKTKPLDAKIEETRLASYLFYKNEEGELIYYTQESDNQEFMEALCKFYTVFIPYEDVDKDLPVLVDGNEVKKTEFFTVEWFNKEILMVEGNGSAYFEYKMDGETPIKTELANIKSADYKEQTNSFLQHRWLEANSSLNKLPTFKKANDDFGFYNTMEFVFSALIGAAFAYIMFPLIFKNGVTVGKKVFGLCLADSDGYTIKNHQVFLRIIPLYIFLLALLIPIWKTYLALGIAVVVVFLTTFTFVMASPKKCAIHDFAARTIVVNARTSILFDNAAEEEAYIAKEDNVDLTSDDRGEEPDLKYEK